MRKCVPILFVICSIIAASVIEYRSLPEKAVKYPEDYQGGIGNDFHVYYEAARGNYQWIEKYYHGAEPHGFTYPHVMRYAWCWTIPFRFETAFLINTILYTLFFCILFLRIYKHAKSEMEKILVVAVFIAGISWFRMCVASGNIIPFLALLILTPWGCVLAGCFKLWLLGFLGIHFILFFSSTNNESSSKIHDTFLRSYVSVAICGDSVALWMEKVVCYISNYDSLF